MPTSTPSSRSTRRRRTGKRHRRRRHRGDPRHRSSTWNIPSSPGMAASQLTLLANSNMISDTGIPDDTGPGLAWGHGTHVAGVLDAAAPGARPTPIRILDSQGRGNTFVLAYAIELAIASNGADVINLSLGVDCGSPPAGRGGGVCDGARRRDSGAGCNDASATPQCPAKLPGVLAVAAVDEDRQRATWSNYGRTLVDLVHRARASPPPSRSGWGRRLAPPPAMRRGAALRWRRPLLPARRRWSSSSSAAIQGN